MQFLTPIDGATPLLVKRLYKDHVRRYHRLIIATLGLFLIIAATTSIQPLLLQQAFDKVFQGKDLIDESPLRETRTAFFGGRGAKAQMFRGECRQGRPARRGTRSAQARLWERGRLGRGPQRSHGLILDGTGVSPGFLLECLAWHFCPVPWSLVASVQRPAPSTPSSRLHFAQAVSRGVRIRNSGER